jgi:cytokinin dehydrogenase
MAPDRRMFLGATFGVTASGLMMAANADPNDTSFPGGNVSRDPRALAAAADDFGGLIHGKPRALVRPKSGADIASLMRWANQQRAKVAARGQGHSVYGRAQAEGGIVIDMGAIDAIHHIGSDRVVVDAGAPWSRVLDATLAQGLTPPVLTNYLGLSVGGTIAVGGIGGSSSRYGMQTDQVIELDVVSGDGNELTCSASSNPDLFHAVRAGLGQCGVITRATLRLVRAPARVRRYQLFYRDLASLTADQRRVLTERRFDQLQGAILPDGGGRWRYQLEGAVYHDGDTAPDDKKMLAALSDDRGAAVIADQTYRDDALAFAKLEKLLRSNGQWSHPKPWLLTFLRGSNAEQLAGEIVGGLTNDDVGPFGRISYYPLLTGAFRTPLLRLPEEDTVFVFNVIRIPASHDASTMERMVGQNRALHDRIRGAGGTQYPVGAFPMSTDDWKDHFGPAWPLLSAAKRRYDPGRLLTPGYNVFG